jgi:hypothetical protein
MGTNPRMDVQSQPVSALWLGFVCIPSHVVSFVTLVPLAPTGWVTAQNTVAAVASSGEAPGDLAAGKARVCHPIAMT